MVSVQQGFPQLSAPVADISRGGSVTQPWLQFFISLWNRTGGQEGGAIFFPGDLKPIASNFIPSGWLLCDGSAVSRSFYSALFSNIGIAWGAGDGANTFNIPDLRGRSAIGVASGKPLGSSGGSETTTLSIENLPSHNHAVSDPTHFHASLVAANNVATGASSGGVVAGDTDPALTDITIQNTGEGTAFSTISPYGAVNWLIKT